MKWREILFILVKRFPIPMQSGFEMTGRRLWFEMMKQEMSFEE